MKKYQKEQEDIKHIKEFIASCGEHVTPRRAALLPRPAEPSRNARMRLPPIAPLISLAPALRRAPGTYANLVKQAKSKQKILDKMYEAGLTEPVRHERTFAFSFPGAHAGGSTGCGRRLTALPAGVAAVSC